MATNCAGCSTPLNIDECINCNGRIMCGHCFVSIGSVSNHKLPDSIPIHDGTVNGGPDEIMVQMMAMIVMHEDRIKSLEDDCKALQEKFDLLSVQFDSICG